MQQETSLRTALDTSSGIDPITLEILWSRLIGISEEMWTTVWRTAFSTIVAVVQDHGCEILDVDGGCLAHAPSSMPAFNLTMPNVAKHVLQKFPVETMQPGDVFITNDPWLCAGHLPDICVITPIFHREKVVAFSGSVAHAIDIGGTTDSRKAREVYEEGLFFPIMKLYDAGRQNEALYTILAANVRNPVEVVGDLEAEVAANEVGARRVVAMLEEYGLDDLEAVSREIQGRTEAAMRAAISSIPDGVYYGERRYDGLGDTPLRIVTNVIIEGDKLTVDFTGTSEQLERGGGINAPMVYSAAHTAYALMCMLTPHLPNNEGCFRALNIYAPEGCIVNCTYPASVNDRTRSGWHIQPALHHALADVLPNHVMGGSGYLQSFRTRGLDDGHGNAFNVPAFSGGGQGAVNGQDGMPGYIFPSTASGMSVEMFELKSPGLVRSKALLADSGGAGAFRGGLGQRIEIAKLPGYEAPLRIDLRPDLMIHPPQGLRGGRDGRRAHVSLNGAPPAPDSLFYSEGGIVLDSVSDTITFDIPGGGGYGDPADRDPAAIERDLAFGFVTPEGVKQDYGTHVVSDGNA